MMKILHVGCLLYIFCALIDTCDRCYALVTNPVLRSTRNDARARFDRSSSTATLRLYIGRESNDSGDLIPLTPIQKIRESTETSLIATSSAVMALILASAQSTLPVVQPLQLRLSKVVDAADVGMYATLKTDEVEVLIESEPLGLGLVEIEYKGAVRTQIKSVKDYAAESTRALVKPDMIVVSVNGECVEGLPLDDVYQRLKAASKPLRLILRDPDLFFSILGDSKSPSIATSTTTGTRRYYTTTVLPATLAPGSIEQVLSVEKVTLPVSNIATTGARATAPGDTVEIVYQAKLAPLVQTSNTQLSALPVIDGVSDSLFSADSYKDVYASSLYFVLGSPNQQGKYTFFGTGGVAQGKSSSSGGGGGGTGGSDPSSSSSSSSVGVDAGGVGGSGGVLRLLPAVWDCLLVGMPVGEIREVSLPPAYYNNKNLLKEWSKLLNNNSNNNNNLQQQLQKNRLVVRVKLLSINGVAS